MLPYLLLAVVGIAILMRNRDEGVLDPSFSMLVKGYKAGVPFDLIVDKVDGVWMGRRCGQQFLLMKAAALRDGVLLHVNSGFRSMGEQEHFFNMTPEEREKAGIGQQVAKPGFSNHQSGLALDISTQGPALAWLRANARRFDFTNTVPSEPWHFEISHV